MVDQLTVFGQVTALTMLQHMFSSYGVINEIDLEENAVKIMGPYNPTEPISQLIGHLEKGDPFVHHYGVEYYMASCSREFSPLFQMSN